MADSAQIPAPPADEKRARLAQLLSQRAAQASPAAVQAPAPAPVAQASGFVFAPEFDRLRAIHDKPAPFGLKGLFNLDCEGVNAATAQVDGRELINFSSYNYLGFSGDADVSAAAKAAIDRFGTSVSASRLVSGQRPLHRELEEAIAGFLGTEDALAFVGGFSTNQTVVGHICGPQDLILYDSLIHASVQQGARQSGATLVPFPHNNPEALDNILTRRRASGRQALVVIEGVYSMDGDIPNLADFIAVKERHNALLMVDEAHSIGTLGHTGRGLAEHAQIGADRVDIWMGTLSKAFASCGGYIAARRELIDYLRLTVPGFIYSVGLTPADTAAALAALTKLQAEPERVTRLQARSARFLSQAKAAGLDTGDSGGSPVVPVMTGTGMRALALSHKLLDQGILAHPISYPAVPEDKSRLRFFVSATHSDAAIDATVECVARSLAELD